MNPLERPAHRDDLARIASLAHRHARDRSGLYFVEGVRPFLHALEAGLPILGRADSLNVGVAAGIMLYEVLRRRMVGSAAAWMPPTCPP